jgi:hypothetical protein
MKSKHFVLYGCALIVSSSLASAQVSESLQWKSIFGTSQVNGKAVQIESARTANSPREELEKIKASWKIAGSHSISETQNGWDLVSRINNGQLEVVQAKPSATGSYLMRHRVSVETPRQMQVLPEWLRFEGKVLFATQTSDAFQSGSSWLIDLGPQANALQTIQVITERTKLFGFQQHPSFAMGPQFSNVKSNYGSAAQTVLSAEGGRQIVLQVLPNKNSVMLMVTEVNNLKLKDRIQ